MNCFKPLKFQRENIGIGFRSSSTRYTWKIEIDSEVLLIELLCYYLSNKRVININNKPLFKDFDHTFNMKKHVFNIHNSKSLTDLMIDSVSFDKIYNTRLPNRMFAQTEEIKGQNFEKANEHCIPEPKFSSDQIISNNKTKNEETLQQSEKKISSNANLLTNYNENELTNDIFFSPLVNCNEPQKISEASKQNNDFNILFS